MLTPGGGGQLPGVVVIRVMGTLDRAAAARILA
jgi:hypothetical protein